MDKIDLALTPQTLVFLDVLKLYPNGSVEFLNGASPNDAAIAFLKAVNSMAPNFLRNAKDD